MKITIEKDDGTKIVIEGPSAWEDAKKIIVPVPAIPYDPIPWINPLTPIGPGIVPNPYNPLNPVTYRITCELTGEKGTNKP